MFRVYLRSRKVHANIDSQHRPRLPKYYETFIFFKIRDADDFKPHLKDYSRANKFTTGAECKKYIDENYHNDEVTERKDLPPEQRKPFDAVNVAFSIKGMNEVRNARICDIYSVLSSNAILEAGWRIQ